MTELVYHIDGQRMSFALEGQDVTIGRAPNNHLVIQDSSISRVHARFSKGPDGWAVADMGSKNGTVVNELGSTDCILKDGDEIILGRFPMTFSGADDQAVELTASEPGEMVEDMGTMIRSAIDFSALAGAGPSDEEETTPELDVDRLQKLLSVVTEASKILLTSNGLDETLSAVLGLVFDQLPVERGFIALWDEESQSLKPRCQKTRSGDLEKIKFSRTIAEKVYHDKVCVLTTDAQCDDRFAGGASIMALGIRSAMSAPLWNGDKVEGIIYVDTPFHIKAFDDFDLDLMSALGNHVAVALERARLEENILEQKVSQSRLERYHSPAVIARITNLAEGETLVADERVVTVVFADIVGFTTRCETMEPRAVAEMLNSCFSGMAEAIFKHEGTLDKFIGDCVMAVFGAPLDMPDHARRAVQATLDMRGALDEANEGVEDSLKLRMRVGMHSGKVVAGDIGSVRRSDYTVLGATVNLASRMESSVAKAGQIAISDATYEMVKDHFDVRPLGEFQPKGISRIITGYEVIGPR